MKQDVVPGLRKRWSTLRGDLLFLPKLEQMQVTTEGHSLEVVEFLRVEPQDEEVVVPEAPDVPTESVLAFPDWSDAAEDQQRMWRLVGTVITGDRETHTCPDCHATKRLTCSTCGGDGRVACSWCFGSGQQSCSSCGGSGSTTVTRTETDSDGHTIHHTESHSCSSCGGGGRTRCWHCSGWGHVTCHTCGGGGEVVCDYCSPAGTVDRFIRRSFVAVNIRTDLMPIRLPGYPQPIRLTPEYVEIGARLAETPYDAVQDSGLLGSRGIKEPAARIFFLRQGLVHLHTVCAPDSGATCATYIDGKANPILTLHRAVQDRRWSPDVERRKGLLAFVLYSSVVLAGSLGIALEAPWVGAGVAALLLVAALVTMRNPLRALRLTFRDTRCFRHNASAVLRCSGCGNDLCHECVLPSVRCPNCGESLSDAVTHLIEEGKWVEAQQEASS